MTAVKTIIIENISRRLHVINGINLAPTQALEFPEDVMNQGGVIVAFDMNELKLADEKKDPITSEDDAEAELKRRAEAKAGKNQQQQPQQDANGAPAPKVNAGK